MVRIAPFLFLAATVSAAPVPKDGPRPTVAALREVLGKSHTGKEVRAVGRQLGAHPVIKYSMWDDERDSGREDEHFHLVWESKGIDIHFYKGRADAVWLYNDGADGHKRYAGELPGGLSFGDDRAAVEKKLGKPTEVTELPARRPLGKGREVEEVWLSYPKGLTVTLRRPVRGEWAIHHISIQSEDGEDK